MNKMLALAIFSCHSMVHCSENVLTKPVEETSKPALPPYTNLRERYDHASDWLFWTYISFGPFRDVDFSVEEWDEFVHKYIEVRSVDIKDPVSGDTPLHCCVSFARYSSHRLPSHYPQALKLFKWLLSKGASYTIPNSRNETVEQLVERNGREEFKFALREHKYCSLGALFLQLLDYI